MARIAFKRDPLKLYQVEVYNQPYDGGWAEVGTFATKAEAVDFMKEFTDLGRGRNYRRDFDPERDLRLIVPISYSFKLKGDTP